MIDYMSIPPCATLKVKFEIEKARRKAIAITVQIFVIIGTCSYFNS